MTAPEGTNTQATQCPMANQMLPKLNHERQEFVETSQLNWKYFRIGCSQNLLWPSNLKWVLKAHNRCFSLSWGSSRAWSLGWSLSPSVWSRAFQFSGQIEPRSREQSTGILATRTSGQWQGLPLVLAEKNCQARTVRDVPATDEEEKQVLQYGWWWCTAKSRKGTAELQPWGSLNYFHGTFLLRLFLLTTIDFRSRLFIESIL